MAEYKSKAEGEFPEDAGLVIDYSQASTHDINLIMLLTDKEELFIYLLDCEVPQCSRFKLSDLNGFTCDAPSAICLSQDALCTALLESSGALLLISTRYLTNISMSRPSLLNGEDVVRIDVNIANKSCLCVPTCALWYYPTPEQPMIITCNKGGEILFLNLRTRKISVVLEAPQSIHHMQLLHHESDVVLLATGFTGAQWMIPISNGGRSLRETLNNVIPSEMCQLHPGSGRLMQLTTGYFGLLLADEKCLKLFDSLSLHKPIRIFSVPENTWLVDHTNWILFTANEEAIAYAGIHFLDNEETIAVDYCQVTESLPTGRILAILPTKNAGLLPECRFVTEKGLYRLVPLSSIEQIFLDYLLLREHELNEKIFETMSKKMNISLQKLALSLINQALPFSTNTSSRYSVELSIKIGLICKVPLKELVTVFDQFSLVEHLIPHIGADPSMRKYVISLYLTKISSSTAESERLALEKDLRAYLNEQNCDFSGEIARLLQAGLWSCVVVLMGRNDAVHKEVADFLSTCSIEKLLLHCSCPQLIQAISQLSWSSLDTALANGIFKRLTKLAASIQSADHLAALAQTAFLYMKRYPAALQLNTFCNLCLSYNPGVAQTSFNSEPRCLIACGANASAVICENALFFWGQLHSQKKTLSSAATSPKRSSGQSSYISSLRNTLPKPRSGGKTMLNLLSSSTPLPIPLARKIRSVSIGAEHVLLLGNDGELLAWGNNRYGQCGVGHRNRVNEPQLIALAQKASNISAGIYHSATVTVDASVYLWGWGLHSQLGLYNQIAVDDALIPMKLDCISEQWANVACGYAHTLLLTKCGRLFACGNSSFGQIGKGSLQKQRQPIEIVFDEPVAIIATKYFHSVIATASGRLLTWGSTPQALKFQALLKKRKGNAAADEHGLLEGKIQDFGVDHLSPRIVPGLPSSCNIVQLSCGLSHSALIDDQGVLYTWGKSLEMQLGHGDKKERNTPHPIHLSHRTTQLTWQSAMCGSEFTLALATNGEVYAWGRNDKGQCGVQTPKPTMLSGRVLTVKSSHGPRTIRLPATASCLISEPILVPGVAVSLLYDRFAKLNDQSLLEQLQRCSSTEFAQICSDAHLPDPIVAYIHLLAGSLPHAIQSLPQLADQQLPLLLPIVQLAASVDQPRLLAEIVNRAPANSTIPSEFHSTLSALTVAGASLRGLSAKEKLQLVKEMDNEFAKKEIEPELSLNSVDILQNEIESLNDPIQYWTGCKHVEACENAKRPSTTETRCSKCVSQWKENMAKIVF